MDRPICNRALVGRVVSEVPTEHSIASRLWIAVQERLWRWSLRVLVWYNAVELAYGHASAVSYGHNVLMIKPDRLEESDAMTLLLYPITRWPCQCAENIAQAVSRKEVVAPGPQRLLWVARRIMFCQVSLQIREGHSKEFSFRLTRWINNRVYIYNTESDTIDRSSLQWFDGSQFIARHSRQPSLQGRHLRISDPR
jgi:hypothetical protein